MNRSTTLRLLCAAIACTFLQPAQAALALDSGSQNLAGGNCQTVESIARTNRGIVTEVFRLAGEDARLFLAADPALLDYEDQYRRLMRARPDQIVVWRHRRMKGIGMAVPFAAGCAVEEYGEPDLFEKLEAMRSLVAAVGKRGLDDPDVRRRLRDLATFRERTATGDIISTDDEVQRRVDALAARLAEAKKGELSAADGGDPGDTEGCVFSDINVSVDVPEGYSHVSVKCPTVGYSKSIGEDHVLGFYVVETPVTFSLDYDGVQEFVDGQTLITQVQFDKTYGTRLLESRLFHDSADYPEAIIWHHGACAHLVVKFPMASEGARGVERRRGLVCVAELPPGGSNRWTIINVFMFEMNFDPGHIEPAGDFELVASAVFRSLRFNEED